MSDQKQEVEIPRLSINTTESTDTIKIDSPLLDLPADYTNGAWIIRFVAFVAVICNLFFCLNVIGMIILGGATGSAYQNTVSPTLVCFVVIIFFTLLMSLHDLYKTWGGTRNSKIPFTWDWCQASFVRLCIPLTINGLILFPTILTFTFQSIGQQFTDYLGGSIGNAGLYQLLVLLVVSFFGVLLTGGLSFVFVHYALQNGNFITDRNRATLSSSNVTFREVLARIVAASTLAAVVFFSAALVYGNEYETNSGVIIFTIIYLFSAIIISFYNILLLFRRFHTKKWWLAFRALTGAHIFTAYFVFWVVLLLISLIGATNTGFWQTVQNTTMKRQALIYTHLVCYLVYCMNAGARVYYLKLKKTGRQPRVLQAIRIDSKSKLFQQLTSSNLNAAATTQPPAQAAPATSATASTSAASASSSASTAETHENPVIMVAPAPTAAAIVAADASAQLE